ncbi:MAG: alpha-1,2-fucosyltransferase [Bacteroidota bacterium]
MVIVTLGGGLGNQLFQYATARQVALRNKTQLKLYISNITNEPNRTYKLGHFNIVEEFATEEEVDRLIKPYYTETLYAKLYRKLDTYRPKFRRKYYRENAYWGFEAEVMKIGAPVLLEGFWQHREYAEAFSPGLRNELTLKSEYTSNDQILAQIVNDENAVSLHFRRGDYQSDPNNLNFFGVLPLEYYLKAIDHMLEKVPQAIFYVFSDDLAWVKENLPTTARTVFVDIEGGTKDYLELDAMSKCRHNVIANSSFSWWAAYLNTNPNKIVIAPKRWVVDEQQNSKVQVQLPEWIQM